MIGDPKKCRRHAKHCFERASETANENLKRKLLELGETWLRLADELNNTRVIMDEVAKHQMAES